MTTRSQLALSALAFAVLWTAGMWWWTEPRDIAGTIVLLVIGALTGLAWYWLYGKWYRWYFGRKD
jgi:hypothetical protein